MKKVIYAQGEVSFWKIENLPANLVEHTDKNTAAQPIIAHSESGHNHVLERPAKVLRPAEENTAMNVFYAILNDPTALIQDAPTPHERIDLDAGIWEFRIAREHDPFTQQARQVAD